MIWPLLAVAMLMPHPIHTTVLELRWDARTRVIEGTLRVFEDDLRAVTASERVTASAYVMEHLELTIGGKSVVLSTCGERKAGEAVLVCLRGNASDARAWRVRNTILMDRYEDQVNIVRVENGTTSTLLLTRRSPVRGTG